METSATTVSSFRRFATVLLAISPRRVAETALVMLGVSATEGIGLLLLVPLLQLVGVNAQQGPLTGVAATFSRALLRVGLQPTLGVVLAIYVAAVAVQSFLERRQAVLSHLIEREVTTTLRVRLYRAIVGARWTAFARARSSDYTQVLTEEVGRVGMATYWLIDVAVVAATAVVYIGLAARVSPGMTALVLLCGGVLALTVRSQLEKSRRHGEEHSAASGRVYAVISEHLASLKLARSYGADRRHTDDFERLSGELSEVGVASTRLYSGVRQHLSVGTAAVLAVIVYVSYTVLAVSTAQLLLLLFLFGRLVPRLTNLYQKTQLLASMLPAFAIVADMEQRCLAAAEPPVERHLEVALAERITVDHVTVDYREDEHALAVRDVSLTIEAGATTAIVGPSGSGKSTLADVVMGFVEPVQGRVLVDGHPLTRNHLLNWRAQIGYVPQDTFLFHESVRANLLWARPGATEDDVWRALRLAAADAFVTGLPEGLDTVVGDRGVLISGGERQRLSLARALLRQPKLLLLDEATSSLDSENEARIQQAIDNLHEQMTIVVITHRLSTVRGADMIHVLDQGRLVESGTWAELVARRGRFRELCLAQGLDDSADAAGEAAIARMKIVRR